MAGIEFRSKATYYYDPVDADSNQLILPMDVGIQHEVHWYHGYQEVRRRLFGHRVVTHMVMQEKRDVQKITYMNAELISELKDPNLRYALRLADAAEAVGWTETSPGAKSAHTVWVTAVDAGVDSKFLSAAYTGIGKGVDDTFMQNLHSASPASQ